MNNKDQQREANSLRATPTVERREGVLIISQYSLPRHKRNMNAYQRVLYAPDDVDLTVLLRRAASVSDEIEQRAVVVHAPFRHRLPFLAYALFFVVVFAVRGGSAVVTEPSGFAAVGFFARFVTRRLWVLDVWDRPRWRTGEHEDPGSNRLSDRLIFWMMRHADLYLLSVMPRAARDIDPPLGRSLVLRNAIDPAAVANEPQDRQPGEPLELVLLRSYFHPTMGLPLLIEAIENLCDAGIRPVVHLIGEVPQALKRAVQDSAAASCFKLHGTVTEPDALTTLLQTMHVGLVPYPPLEDLSYIYPIKVLEYMSQGCVVIASRLPGLEAMIEDGRNGLLVEPGSAPALAQAIRRLSDDQELCRRLAQGALESARSSDARAKNEVIFETITTAIDAKRPR